MNQEPTKRKGYFKTEDIPTKKLFVRDVDAPILTGAWKQVTMNRRARLVSGCHKQPWVDFGDRTFIETAKEYARTFYGSFVVSGEIIPGTTFCVEVEEVDDGSGSPVVPSCIFQMQASMKFDVLNPRLGSD